MLFGNVSALVQKVKQLPLLLMSHMGTNLNANSFASSSALRMCLGEQLKAAPVLGSLRVHVGDLSEAPGSYLWPGPESH